MNLNRGYIILPFKVFFQKGVRPGKAFLQLKIAFKKKLDTEV